MQGKQISKESGKGEGRNYKTQDWIAIFGLLQGKKQDKVV